ncbi:rhodanese-like domain-containing protein [Pseudomonadota bacterium]
MQKRIIHLLSFSFITAISFGEIAYAVPPPDFLFNVAGQMVQVFGIVALFLSAALSMTYRYIKMKLALMKSKKPLFIVGALVAILVVSLGSGYLYGNYKQEAEYQKWLAESQKYSDLQQEKSEYLGSLNGEKAEDPAHLESIEANLTTDKLKIGESPIIEEEEENGSAFKSYIEENGKDDIADFIENYYSAIANQEIEKAYAMSKKSAGYETFKGWYKDTTKITLNKLVRINETESSVELTLFEGNTFTRYGVVIDVLITENKPKQIASSSVRTLFEGTLTEENDQTIVQKKELEENLFSSNKDYPISISNKDLNALLKSGRSDYMILDARENLEYENGYLNGSTHIRYADLQAGKWIEIPEDKYIIVLCWSGIRGKEVAEFLRTKNLVASYLKNGANGWVEWGGIWTGNIKLAQKYTEDRYKKIFTTSEVKKKIAEGVILVDSREPWKYSNWHIDGSVSIPIMYTPSKSLSAVFAAVPPGSTIITVCDDYVNCFDAKITAVELEHRGHTFIGRYNKPWEYE